MADPLNIEFVTPLTIHYTKLPNLNPGDPNSPDKYACSDCDHDVFVLDLHSEFGHGTDLFVVDEVEQPRISEPPFHPCGILGCVLAPHEDGPHSYIPTEA